MTFKELTGKEASEQTNEFIDTQIAELLKVIKKAEEQYAKRVVKSNF